MEEVYESTSSVIQQVCSQAKETLRRGESADEFQQLARVGNAAVYLAASQDHGPAGASKPHANPGDCLLYMLKGEVTVTFPDVTAQVTIPAGGAIKIPSGAQHSAAFRRLALYLCVVDEPGSATRILDSGLDRAGRSFSVVYYPKPDAAIRDTIAGMAAKLTPKWFTERVPSDAKKDLLFQHAVVYWEADSPIGFVTFTSIDRAVHITLMGTDPARHRQGIGTCLMHSLRDFARALGYDCIRLFSKPPDTNPAYVTTVEFYERIGFRKVKSYTELWEDGAIEFEWRLGPAR